MTDRPEASELTPGTPVLGRCVVERFVRRGPLATVYLARARGVTTEWYTVRAVHGEKVSWSDRAAEVFQREMERVREVYHPAIPRLVAFDPAAPAPVVLTAHATGPTVRELVSDGVRPSARNVSRVVSEVAAALASLHAAFPPIIHRTVCPENIIVAEHGSGVWLEECGLAHALVIAGLVSDRPTTVAEPGYLVPDELMSPPGPRADTFALAIVAFEYLTGQRPFDRAGPAALSLAVHGAAFPRADALRADVPPEVDAVFTRAWSLAADGGYDAPMEFARDLTHALGVDRAQEDPLAGTDEPFDSMSDRAERGEPSDGPEGPGPDDLDRAFDAMLHEAPSPPPPSIADLARLVAPPTPLPPSYEPAAPEKPPSIRVPAALPDLPDVPPTAATVVPEAPTTAPDATTAPGARATDTASARGAPDGGGAAGVPRPTASPIPAPRIVTPPPLPARWPTLRAAGGLFRPVPPPPPLPVDAPPPPRTSRPASVRPPPASVRPPTATPPPASHPDDRREAGAWAADPHPVGTRTGPSGTDDRTPIVGYQRISLVADASAAARSSSVSQELSQEDLIALEGSALKNVADLRSGDMVSSAHGLSHGTLHGTPYGGHHGDVYGRQPADAAVTPDEPPAMFDAAEAVGGPSDATPVQPTVPAHQPLQDVPARPGVSVSVSARPSLPSLPTGAPLPSPPSIPTPVPSVPPGSAVPRVPTTSVLQAARVLGVSTVLAAVIAAIGLVTAARDLNTAIGDAERAGIDHPDSALALAPQEPDATPGQNPGVNPSYLPAADASLAASDLGAASDAAAVVALAPTDAGAPGVNPPQDASRIAVGVVPPAVPPAVPPLGLPPAELAHPTDRDRAAVMALLRPRVADCVEGVDLTRVNIGVRYEGATGQAVSIRLHGIFEDPPIAPCLDQAVRAVRMPRFPAPAWETTLSFPIDAPRWHQAERDS